MERRLALLATALALILAACERPPDVARPNTYAKDELAFSLPANWSVTEDEMSSDADGSYRNLVIESPGNAIVLIQR